MMSISSRGRYASRIMTFLATLPSGSSATKYEIAEAEGISAAYVEQLMMPLRLAGLVTSHRGRAGGFSLARDPQTLSLGEILRAVEGAIQVAPCTDPQNCERAEGCPTRVVWQKATNILNDLFSETMIADLACRPAPRPIAIRHEAGGPS
ncbi:MAG: Rrf2 family transcriptional regulator [Actinobacteria bacterium]|nr:Rrf2 family transcriptional regulator [Actinomycetota bacterium]